MEKKYLVFFSTIIFGLNLFGGIDDQSQGNLLWLIELENQHHYILGSLIFFDPSIISEKERILLAFNEAEIVAMEAQIPEDKKQELGYLFLKNGSFQGQEILRKHVSKATWIILEKRLRELKIDPDDVSEYKPWLMAMVLYGWEMERLQWKQESILQSYFRHLSQEKKIIIDLDEAEVISLKQSQFLFDIFNNISEKEAEEFLNYAIVHSAKLKKEYELNGKIWSSGDIDLFEKKTETTHKEYAALRKIRQKVLSRLEKTVIPQMEALFKGSKTAFVIWEAAYLVGDDGILAFLAKKGFKITFLGN